MRNCLVIGGTTDGIGKTFVNFANVAHMECYVPPPDKLDVTSPISICNWLKVHMDVEFHYVLYAAGTKHLNWLQDIDMHDLKHTFDVNVFGFIYLMRELMAHQEFPARVVAITSDAAMTPMRGSLDYCASKAALHMAIKVIARELADRDYGSWFVAGVCPSAVADTEMTNADINKLSGMRDMDVEQIAHELRTSNPMRVMLQREEVASLASWLLFKSPDTMTGSIVEIRGGK